MPPAEWQGGPVEYPRDSSVQSLFEVQAAAIPDSIALIHAGGYLTYAQINTRANHLARHLLSIHHSPAPIALCLDRSPELIVTLLAILKAGACYVPLDPAYPPPRLREMAQDCQARLVITTRALAGSLPDFPAPLLFLEEITPATDPTNPGVPVLATAPAYIIFTSGSTGRPKGVAVPHRAIVRLVRGQDYASFSGETFLQFAPASFDASTFEIWGPLLNGARLAIAPPGQLSLLQIADAIRGFGVTTLWLTSGLFNLMADEQLSAFAPLRQLLAGGDVLSIPHLRKVRAAHPRLRLVNGYGPTESTTFACCHAVTDADLGFAPEIRDSKFETRNADSAVGDSPSVISAGSSIPIGRPLANTRVRILDEQGGALPIGEAGELYIGGDGLALGYWNQPALTAEKFVRIEGETFYRTGDRVRWLPSGAIEFLGRLDHQVKIRGHRVELGEVEAVLGLQPGVLRCVVVALGDGADKLLAAYHAGPAEPAALREALRQRLPEPMVPAFFTRLDSLPLTQNGKIDRARLPAPAPTTAATAPSAASNDLETTLATLWSEVLHQPAPGLHDNFFDIGGTSLKLVEAHSRLVRALRRHIPVTALFQYPTIASLAAYLAPDATCATPPSRITPADRARMQRAALARNQLSQKIP